MAEKLFLELLQNIHTVCFQCIPIWGLLKYTETKLQTICFYFIQHFFKKQKRSVTKKKLYGPFSWMGSAASRLMPLRGGSLLFTTKFLDIPGTHFIGLGRMKVWVNLGATQWFWTQDLWIASFSKNISLVIFYWLIKVHFQVSLLCKMLGNIYIVLVC